jgi:hypothetical protein
MILMGGKVFVAKPLSVLHFSHKLHMTWPGMNTVFHVERLATNYRSHGTTKECNVCVLLIQNSNFICILDCLLLWGSFGNLLFIRVDVETGGILINFILIYVCVDVWMRMCVC